MKNVGEASCRFEIKLEKIGAVMGEKNGNNKKNVHYMNLNKTKDKWLNFFDSCLSSCDYNFFFLFFYFFFVTSFNS